MGEYYFDKIIFENHIVTIVIKKCNDKKFKQTIKMTPMDFLVKKGN